MVKASKKILLIAGESSGDHHGARVVNCLKEIDATVGVYGIGGDELARAGMEVIFHSSNLSVVGISEVFSRFGHILKAYRTIKKELCESPPDLLLLIDYPDFNLRIAAVAKKHNVPVLYYVSPQIWAWRKGRARRIARLVDRMAVIFPFEVSLYEKYGLDVSFVGHPILDSASPDTNLTDGLDISDEVWPVIGILPGSRHGEVEKLLPVMLKAAEAVSLQFPSARFLLPLAQGISEDLVRNMLNKSRCEVEIIKDRFNGVLSACDLVFVASGTATLETAVMQKPMIIIYKVSGVSYFIGKLLINVDCIGLANIVAGKKVVPELIQDDANPENIAREALLMLKDRSRMEDIRLELARVKDSLGSSGASQRVARIAHEMIMKRP